MFQVKYLKTTTWIAMKFGTDIHDPQWIHPTDSDDSSDFSCSATMKLTLVVSSEISQYFHFLFVIFVDIHWLYQEPRIIGGCPRGSIIVTR